MLFNKNTFLGLAVITAISANAFAAGSAAVAKPRIEKESSSVEEARKNKEAANDASAAKGASSIRSLLKDNITPAARAFSLNLDIADKVGLDAVKAILADSVKNKTAADLIDSKVLNKNDKLELGTLNGLIRIIAFSADKVDLETVKAQVAMYKGTESMGIYTNIENTKAAAMKAAIDRGSRITDREAGIITVLTLRNIAKTGNKKLVNANDVTAAERESAAEAYDKVKTGECAV